MSQISEGLRLIYRSIKAKIGFTNILAEDIISYDTEKPIAGLDLVYVNWAKREFGKNGSAYKSMLTISGIYTIDWNDGLMTDNEGNPNEEEITWVEMFGDYPVITFFVDPLDGSGVEVKIDLNYSKMPNGDIQIDASNLSNVKAIII